MENNPDEVCLPDEVLEKVFLLVRVSDLLNLMNVHPQYRQVARLGKLWIGLTISTGDGRIVIRGRGERIPLDHVSAS